MHLHHHVFPEKHKKYKHLLLLLLALARIALRLTRGQISRCSNPIDLSKGSILPNFHVSIKHSVRDSLPALFQKILQRGALVKEDTQVVAHNVTVLARWALDEYGAVVVSLLGHAVFGSLATRLASEADAVCSFSFAALFVL